MWSGVALRLGWQMLQLQPLETAVIAIGRGYLIEQDVESVLGSY